MTREKKETFLNVGRIISGAYYDMQEVRISGKNRIRDVIRKRLEGIGFRDVEDKKDEKDYAKKYSDDQLLALWEKAEEEGLIDKEEADYLIKCWRLADQMESLEGQYRGAMMFFIRQEVVYTDFLEKVRGIGSVLAANLLKEFGNCERYDNISKLWAHTGNGVVEGVAPKKRKGEDLLFSPRLRMLTWKISDCLMKSNKGFYRGVYDSEKERQLSRVFEAGELLSKFGSPYTEEDTRLKLLHAHNRALRKMRKLFLAHYWLASRELNGLDVSSPFVIEFTEHGSFVGWRDALKQETVVESEGEVVSSEELATITDTGEVET